MKTFLISSVGDPEQELKTDLAIAWRSLLSTMNAMVASLTGPLCSGGNLTKPDTHNQTEGVRVLLGVNGTA